MSTNKLDRDELEVLLFALRYTFFKMDLLAQESAYVLFDRTRSLYMSTGESLPYSESLGETIEKVADLKNRVSVILDADTIAKCLEWGP